MMEVFPTTEVSGMGGGIAIKLAEYVRTIPDRCTLW
jgi:hypothetical protein